VLAESHCQRQANVPQTDDGNAYLVGCWQLGAHGDTHLGRDVWWGGRHYPANAFHSTQNPRKSGNAAETLHYARSRVGTHASEVMSEQPFRRVAMQILVLGGAGYIGGHTSVVLAERGHQVVIADNFSNSSRAAVTRLEQVVGAPLPLHELDVRDSVGLERVFSQYRFDAVMHFAALKAVGESCKKPLDYFDNNISGTITVLRAMSDANVRRLVFSSSATVYGDPAQVPVREDAPLQASNPYGRTKLVMEQLIGDLCTADPNFRAAVLRYFNPVGAHPSGLIGEDPNGPPNNLMPFVCQVAVGRRERLQVFGDDYPTVDGTGVRDYLHVMDLARAHVDALDYLCNKDRSVTVNLGTGSGVSVLQMVKAFERAAGKAIPYDIVARRPGDSATVFADPGLAHALLGWKAEHDLDAMCRDAWRWQALNPQGYGSIIQPD
jgi:UDP-glucose 4-epimerase